MITDGEPTAHIVPNGEGGQRFFNYPPIAETMKRTLYEVVRAPRTVSASTPSCSIPPLAPGLRRADAELNRGRAFFTTSGDSRRLRARGLPRASPGPSTRDQREDPSRDHPPSGQVGDPGRAPTPGLGAPVPDPACGELAADNLTTCSAGPLFSATQSECAISAREWSKLGYSQSSPCARRDDRE